MADGPGIIAPGNFPQRDPRSRPRMQGRVVNPVGYMERPDGSTGLGGMDKPSKLPAHGSAQQVEAPTSVNPTMPANAGGMSRGKRRG